MNVILDQLKKLRNISISSIDYLKELSDISKAEQTVFYNEDEKIKINNELLHKQFTI